MTDNTERNRMMLQRYLSGATLESIGQEVGLTRERVRQIIHGLDPEAPRKHEEVRREAREATKAAKRVIHTNSCKVCDKEFETSDPNRVTCSDACSAVWTKSKRLLDPYRAESMRVELALSALRHPDKHNKYRVQAAKTLVLSIRDGHLHRQPLTTQFYKKSNEFRALVDILGSEEAAVRRVERTQEERGSAEVERRIVEHYKERINALGL